MVDSASNMCSSLRIYSSESSEPEDSKSFFRTQLLRKLDCITQIPRSVTDDPEENVGPSYEVHLHWLIDWFVLMISSVYDCFKSDNEYSVSFKPSLAQIRDPSLAAEFLQV